MRKKDRDICTERNVKRQRQNRDGQIEMLKERQEESDREKKRPVETEIWRQIERLRNRDSEDG